MAYKFRRLDTDLVCPVEKAGILDNRLRRLVQDPKIILKPYLKEGMIALDVGCGPGYFSLDMARMVGKTGRVIACDLQQGMLQKLKEKIQGTELEERITLQKCEQNKLGVTENVDFILAFWMVHEVPDKDRFLNELEAILKPNGLILIEEPPFHVSEQDFQNTIRIAEAIGFDIFKRPKIFLGKKVILKKS
ncbi:class I SAM-dependent methyltransferase [Candidatus Aquicultor secundus]|uniref:class I SAM-dependent methyltransferase n=1 Tax=Candidatus Aquicultor secundus TaxID=1973895 RepID=UPI000CBE85CC|nr:class I SAM-dependent methyltransferase [Candidatus Aquicultor secundus]PIU26305.1 MAG: SAM-dependent methyltransferase [Candidatus Aquicultor secundus]